MSDPAPFTPPTAEQVVEHLDAHPPATPSKWKRLWPLAPPAFGFGAYLAAPGWVTALILLAAVGGGIGWSAWRLRLARDRQERMRKVGELAMLRCHPEALREAWRLIPESVEDPIVYGTLLMTTGRSLLELRRDDAALACYERLLQAAPKNHPAATHFGTLRAIAALFDDRLAEADDALRKLRDEDERAAPAIRAGVAFARLLQAARTYRVDELIAMGDAAIDTLRPMGVEAGYGYALMAWAHEQRRCQPREYDDTASLAERGRAWWRRATTLLPAEAIAFRLPETRGLGAALNPADDEVQPA